MKEPSRSDLLRRRSRPAARHDSPLPSPLSRGAIITRECSARSLLDQLHDGEIDVACSEDCIPNANFQMKQYPPTYVVVAIHKQHRLAQEKGPIKIKELADEPIIFPTQNTTRGVFENFSRALAKAGVRPRYEYSADNADLRHPPGRSRIGRVPGTRVYPTSSLGSHLSEDHLALHPAVPATHLAKGSRAGYAYKLYLLCLVVARSL